MGMGDDLGEEGRVSGCWLQWRGCGGLKRELSLLLWHDNFNCISNISYSFLSFYSSATVVSPGTALRCGSNRVALFVCHQSSTVGRPKVVREWPFDACVPPLHQLLRMCRRIDSSKKFRCDNRRNCTQRQKEGARTRQKVSRHRHEWNESDENLIQKVLLVHSVYTVLDCRIIRRNRHNFIWWGCG